LRRQRNNRINSKNTQKTTKLKKIWNKEDNTKYEEVE
jgi:hypothetical protein